MDTTNEGSLVNMDSLRRVEEILWILSRMLEAQNNEVFYFPSLDNDIEQLHTDEATYQKLRDAVDHLSRDIEYAALHRPSPVDRKHADTISVTLSACISPTFSLIRSSSGV